MNDVTFAEGLLEELEAETAATQKCIERFKMELFDYKPHETSMQMGYLALLCAEIPLWMELIIKDPDIDLMTFDHFRPTTTEELTRHFLENVEKAKKALQSVTEGVLSENFSLKTNGKVVSSASKRQNLASTINHLIHHRGQLTVYMRLNGIPIPSIYGPSADDKHF